MKTTVETTKGPKGNDVVTVTVEGGKEPVVLVAKGLVGYGEEKGTVKWEDEGQAKMILGLVDADGLIQASVVQELERLESTREEREKEQRTTANLAHYKKMVAEVYRPATEALLKLNAVESAPIPEYVESTSWSSPWDKCTMKVTSKNGDTVYAERREARSSNQWRSSHSYYYWEVRLSPYNFDKGWTKKPRTIDSLCKAVTEAVGILNQRRDTKQTAQQAEARLVATVRQEIGNDVVRIPAVVDHRGNKTTEARFQIRGLVFNTLQNDVGVKYGLLSRINLNLPDAICEALGSLLAEKSELTLTAGGWLTAEELKALIAIHVE